MYSAPVSKHLLMSGLISFPLLSRQMYDLSAGLSIFFCLLAAYEVFHIIWGHFHSDSDWQ